MYTLCGTSTYSSVPRKSAIGSMMHEPRLKFLSLNLFKLTALMHKPLIKGSRESPMPLPIYKGTRYLSRRMITYCKDSLIITIVAKLPLRMPIIMLGMNFATITNYPF